MWTLTLLLSASLATGPGPAEALSAAGATPVRPSAQEAAPAPPQEGEPAGVLQDREAVQDLLIAYRSMDGLRDVRIRLEGRVVILEGTALSGEDRVRAGELAERVTGAVYVDNRIQVERTLSRRLAPAAERFREKGRAFVQFLPVFAVGFLLLALTVLLTVWVGRPSFPYDRVTENVFARNVLRQVTRIVVALTGVLLSLELLGATALVGAVLGTAGLFGLALGFAFRDIAENYLAGILLSLRQPFFPNDHVQLEGHEGKVVRLTGRETILMTLDGNHVRIPNTTVFKGILTNFTRNPRRRFQIQAGIAADEDVGRALRTGKEALQAIPGVLERPPVTGRAQELGASSVELRFAGWVDQAGADFGKVRSEAVRTLKETFEAQGIRTPPPEYGIRMLGTEGEGPEPPPPPPAPGDRRPSEVQEADVAPDTTIDDQIAEEHRASDEENLLKPSGKSGNADDPDDPDDPEAPPTVPADRA